MFHDLIEFKETLLRSFTDNAIPQLRRSVRDIFDFLKKKIKMSCCKGGGEKYPIMLKPTGDGTFFENQDAIDIFVRSFFEYVSCLKYAHSVMEPYFHHIDLC